MRTGKGRREEGDSEAARRGRWSGERAEYETLKKKLTVRGLNRSERIEKKKKKHKRGMARRGRGEREREREKERERGEFVRVVNVPSVPRRGI